MLPARANIIAELQTDILRLERHKPSGPTTVDLGLGPIAEAFPNGCFPVGAIHEFLSGAHDAAASSGFIAGLMAHSMGNHGTSLWISSSRTIFPPAFKSFGIEPHRIIFIDLQKEKDVVWAMDEALKCGALATVVGEVKEISFTASRRLQLAVEQSQVTGFIINHNLRTPNPTACVSRWKISPLPSISIPVEAGGELPGIGFPRWKVELLRIRNGKTGVWDIQWINRKFSPVKPTTSLHAIDSEHYTSVRQAS